MNYNRVLIGMFVLTMLTIGSAPFAAQADFTYGNDEFLDALNAAITNIVDGGEYDTIYSDWFSGDVVLTDDTDANTATEFPAKNRISRDGTLDLILDAGEITFGSDTAYAPFEFVEGDIVKGFDADVAAAVATEFSDFYGVDIKAVMKTNDWDPIIPDLKSGKFDAILSAMTKTDERDQEIDFTRSYYTSKQGILASSASPAVTGITDLNDATITIGVQTGTTSDLYAQASLAKATTKGFTSFDLALAALEAGDVDFVLGDLPVIAFYAVDNPAKGLSVVGDFGDEELFGIGVRENTGEAPSFLPLPILPIFLAIAAIPILRRLRK